MTARTGESRARGENDKEDEVKFRVLLETQVAMGLEVEACDEDEAETIALRMAHDGEGEPVFVEWSVSDDQPTVEVGS